MPIPDYQTLMLPLMKRLAVEKEPVRIRDFLDSVADEFHLTQKERLERIPSGTENLLANRLAWARTYLGKAGLLIAPRRGYVAITDAGQTLLSRSPSQINISTLKKYPAFVEWLRRSQTVADSSNGSANSEPPPSSKAETVTHLTPRERIDAAQKELDAALKVELLEHVREMTPSDFENLVIRLLIAMDYGDGQEEMAKALGGTGDGGIDGVIHQDPLGLERVYVQAKRWGENNNVGSKEIRDFIGALNIQRAMKGVFVSTSKFTAEAREAARNSTVQVVLIDGNRLTELLLRYKVGVLVRATIEIKEIDEGFFDEP